MRYFFSLVLLFLSTNTYAQDFKVKGKVIDSKTNETIEFVNIGISNKGVGTVSNENGLFSLKLNEQVTKNDSIIFSHIGYKVQIIKVSEFENKEIVVSLEPETNILKEVVIVKTKAPKPKKIGRNSKGLGLMHMNFYTYYEKEVDDRLSKEVGMELKVNKNCQIDSLTFNITSNDFKKLKFRVNFYKIGNGLPTEIIVNQNIIFEINNEYLGWFSVDLTPYDIYFTDDTGDIAVTIQWVQSEKSTAKSKYFSISTAQSPLNNAFYREKAMDTWTKSNQNMSFFLSGMCN
jgi:hypothetical protein